MEVETEISSISKLETHGLGSKAVLPFTPFALLKGFAAMRRKLSVLVISAPDSLGGKELVTPLTMDEFLIVKWTSVCGP